MIDAVAIGELLVAHAAGQLERVRDVELPADVHGEALAGAQRRGQVHAHHGAAHGVGQSLATAGDAAQLEAAVKILGILADLQAAEAQTVAPGSATGQLRLAVLGPDVLVHLQPQGGQRIRAVVVVGDAAFAAQALGGVVQGTLQVVVGAVLPVLVAGGAAGGAVGVGRG